MSLIRFILTRSFDLDLCRIAVFSIRVLRDERIVIIAEQRPDCTEEEVREYSLFHLFFRISCIF